MKQETLTIRATDSKSRELVESMYSFAIGTSEEDKYLASVLLETSDPTTYQEINMTLHPAQVETLKSLLSLWITNVQESKN